MYTIQCSIDHTKVKENNYNKQINSMLGYQSPYKTHPGLLDDGFFRTHHYSHHHSLMISNNSFIRLKIKDLLPSNLI